MRQPTQGIHMSTDLQEINDQILSLNRQRTEMLATQEKEKIDEFLKLEWTKEYEVFLKCRDLSCAGLPTYYLLIPDLNRQDCNIGRFDSTGLIFVFGDCTKPYEYNISYRQNGYEHSCPCFTTSCSQILIEFISKVKFKKIHYDETRLSLLLAAKTANE